MKLYLAFQKDPDDNLLSKIFNFIIKIYTRSKYSHVELFFDDIWVSADIGTGVVIYKLKPLSTKYDYYEIEVDEKYKKDVYDFLKQVEGYKYDWLGIFLAQFIKLRLHEDKKYICSELVADILKKFNIKLKKESIKYSPASLYKELGDKLVTKRI